MITQRTITANNYARLEMDIRMILLRTFTLAAFLITIVSTVMAEESVNPTDTADIVDSSTGVVTETGAASDPAPADSSVADPATVNTGEPAEKRIRYVNDNLMVMMRAGNSNKHKIVRHITSGTELELLETVDDYSRVRTRKGTEGWVLNQYLTEQPIARDRLKTAQQQVSRLETQNKQLQKELNELSKQYDKLSDNHNKLTDELQNFRTVAAKPMKLQEENMQLNSDKTALENEKEALTQEIHNLRDQSSKQWFMAGAGVLFFGVLIGVMVPRMRRRRKSDWSSL